MSHELRTPLNSVLGRSEALQMVTVGPESGGVCLRVADTGLGIPADALPRV